VYQVDRRPGDAVAAGNLAINPPHGGTVDDTHPITSRPRLTGVVYLLYFLTAILGAVLAGRP
jgi:hypothetical protein